MLITLSWIDIPSKMRELIIEKMLISFHKEWNNKIEERFTRGSCIVDFYYNENKLKGICICWDYVNFHYLDKFFIFDSKRGEGTNMLREWIERYKNKKLLWRTDNQISYFYLKHPDVIYHLTHNNYIYLGVKSHCWEFEDYYDLISIKSCFSKEYYL
jgi:hypothetical protein